MRSGTSMLAEVCQASGMEVAYSERRNALNRADGTYRPNHKGLFEPEYKLECSDPEWPRQYDGKVLKVVAPFVKHLAVHDYDVIFLLRDLEEIRQSYRAAFAGDTGFTIDQIAAVTDDAIAQLKNRKDVKRVTVFWYDEIIACPDVLKDSGWPITDVSTVDPDQYRFRKDKLVVGL